MVDRFHALHEGMVHVAHLILPGAEPSAAEDMPRIEDRLDLVEQSVPLQERGRIAMLSRRCQTLSTAASGPMSWAAFRPSMVCRTTLA